MWFSNQSGIQTKWVWWWSFAQVTVEQMTLSLFQNCEREKERKSEHRQSVFGNGARAFFCVQSYAINISQPNRWLVIAGALFFGSFAMRFFAIIGIGFLLSLATTTAMAVKDVDVDLMLLAFIELKGFLWKDFNPAQAHSNCNHFLCDVICKLIKWRMSWPEQKEYTSNTHTASHSQTKPIGFVHRHK